MSAAPWKIFLAGIMQGSHIEPRLHGQSYRDRLRELLAQYLPSSEIYDPLADHGESLTYDDATARHVFMRHNNMCRNVDLVVAYVPEASMGTAIEMWEAYRHGRAVISITPLVRNWAVRFLSHAIYPDLAAFERDLAAGRVADLVGRVLAERS